MATKRKCESTIRKAAGNRKSQATKAIKQGTWFNPYSDYQDSIMSDFITMDDGKDYFCASDSLELILVPSVIRDEFIPF